VAIGLGQEGQASLATMKRIRALERELARKEKALAEAAALLVLKKTPSAGGGRGRRHRRDGRAVIVAGITEARQSGAWSRTECSRNKTLGNPNQSADFGNWAGNQKRNFSCVVSRLIAFPALRGSDIKCQRPQSSRTARLCIGR
jgi:hypothetical protein